MGAPGVDGGRVFSAALSDELVEPVAQVLDLARAQDAAHPHQLGLVVVVVAAAARVAPRPQQLPVGGRVRGSRPRQPQQRRSDTLGTRRPCWNW